MNNLRYIINNLDYEIVQGMEKLNTGALDNLCMLYSLNLQIEKESYGRKQRKTEN